MKLKIVFDFVRQLSTKSFPPKICIVGAGPAGFYAAQQLIKSSNQVEVDILERLPVPYGLVRYGVAPDHPEVKNVINTFHKTAKNSRVQFLGNINVGRDVSVQELKENYHAIILTYGAEEDRLLNIPGENLNNVISGRRFVGWYNGIPSDRDLNINLDVEEAVVIGQGNVAIDIARILLTPIDKLKVTDITSYSLEQLSRSKVRKVWLVGRRGPLQAAFTTAELREIIKLERCKTIWRSDNFIGIKEILSNLARPRRRLTELMLQSLENSSSNEIKFEKELHPIFLRSPIKFIGTEFLNGVKFAINQLKGDDILNKIAEATEKIEEISCGLALRSIGYKSVPIDKSIEFDLKRGRIINSSGKVDDNIYAAGWVATGPNGVILSTMNNAFAIGSMINKEIHLTSNKNGSFGLKEILQKKGIQIVTYEDWEKIDKIETERGKIIGKPREKIVDISEMLEIAGKS
ncbi:NADPH:adrenodoxin oxidoreductase, mitochondrial-like isoform X2 [Leptopilina boulardi]|uniref:NADPH:adrenodoxin oxidoreductase, mitochondrial-like isoform X2 n=1 Tax=Leptopilina boulardi TaxID=63433 RepID=UPI0021F505C8|nr:NADPH:adrenodoxin oxidoreductase, mitochondrial-like isoform X2 [Leptopilina boulardi]XP_051153922.1 NADPH:adrenodoxin oxidoreductase, mitochondrial-like isoform X2 [Leptopilina boulardi]